MRNRVLWDLVYRCTPSLDQIFRPHLPVVEKQLHATFFFVWGRRVSIVVHTTTRPGAATLKMPLLFGQHPLQTGSHPTSFVFSITKPGNSRSKSAETDSGISSVRHAKQQQVPQTFPPAVGAFTAKYQLRCCQICTHTP